MKLFKKLKHNGDFLTYKIWNIQMEINVNGNPRRILEDVEKHIDYICEYHCIDIFDGILLELEYLKRFLHKAIQLNINHIR